MIFVWMFACQPEPTEVTEPELTPSPYIVEEDDPPVPALTNEQVGDAIGDAVNRIFEFNAAPVVRAYKAAADTTDAACPDYYNDGTNTYWYDYCWTESGTYYAGYGFLYQYQNLDGGDGYLYNGDYFYLVADVTNAAGYTFSGSGAAYDVVLTHEGTDTSAPHTVSYSVIQGVFAYDGPEVAGTWMTEGVTPDLTLSVYDVPEATSPYYNGQYLTIQGGVSGLGGDLGTVIFDGAIIFSEMMGSTCTIEPSGTISARDNAGQWYDVLFDGPTEYGEQVDPELCDGCGQVWYRGEPLGEACVDFSHLLDWSGRPW